jgi:hypothetical protein
MLVVSAVLTACGKKGGGGGSSSPAAGAAGACALNQFGGCAGGVGQGGVVPANTWDGNVAVTNPNKFRQFMADTGLCYAQQCVGASGFFRLAVQTIRDSNVPGGPTSFATLPGAVNFSIAPRFNGYYSRVLRTQGDGYANAGNNGFQVVYNQMQMGMGQMGYNYLQPGMPGYVNPAAQPNRSLQIVVTWADATQTIANATVLYQGTAFAQGQIRAQFYGGPNVLNGVNGVNRTGQGPAVVPYQGQQQTW